MYRLSAAGEQPDRPASGRQAPDTAVQVQERDSSRAASAGASIQPLLSCLGSLPGTRQSRHLAAPAVPRAGEAAALCGLASQSRAFMVPPSAASVAASRATLLPRLASGSQDGLAALSAPADAGKGPRLLAVQQEVGPVSSAHPAALQALASPRASRLSAGTAVPDLGSRQTMASPLRPSPSMRQAAHPPAQAAAADTLAGLRSLGSGRQQEGAGSGSEADVGAPSTSHQAESSQQAAAATSLTPSPQRALGGGRRGPPRQASVAARESLRRWTLRSPTAKQESAGPDELGPRSLLPPSHARQRSPPGGPSRRAGCQHSPPGTRSMQELAAPVVEAVAGASLQGASPGIEGTGGREAPMVRDSRCGSTGGHGAAPA